MIFYLGDIVEGLVPKKKLQALNKMRKWEYGYNEEFDVIIISKDGTLGEIYNVSGINIGLPMPPKKTEILNNEHAAFNQKWKRHETPQGLTEETMNQSRFADYIEREFNRRENGLWIYINGKPVYMTGTYYFGIQWVKEQSYYPSFRMIQNELMIFWEACKADDRCYGMQYVKNRRIGASFLAIVELLEAGTINEDKILGMVSKKGDDAKKIFRRLIKGFKRLPCFFQPLWDGTNTPKKELILDVPTKRRAKGEVVNEDGLGSSISYHNTEINAMDGEAIFRSLLDESGKFPKDVPFSEYWYIVKTSHTKGIRITGKSMVVSTVNAFSKGGSEYKKIWDDSDVDIRDGNGETKSGLYRIFIEAEKCLEGMFDEYGFTIIEDPKNPIKTDEGKTTKVGSKTFLKNKSESLKGDPEKFNEFKRQFPDSVRDAFRDESGHCAFNLIKLQEQIEHNEFELKDKYNQSKEYMGNDSVERGNFTWKDGVKDTEVIWRPDPENGRFFIKSGCHPIKEFKNKFEKKWANGILAKAPLGSEIGSFGIDPYNRSKTADGRGSFGSCHLVTKEHTFDELPNSECILEYIARPRTVELFFEDMIMVSFYYSIPFLCELSNERFLATIKDRGYRHYSINNPYKPTDKLSPTEIEFGGAPQQDAKIGDGQFYAAESYIEDHIGVARDQRKRMQGEMGSFVFSRTLYQLKEVDPEKRTKFDAYISFTLALLGNKKKVYVPIPQPKIKTSIFQKYDNQGSFSKAI